MKAELEALHKLVGGVAGEICMALTRRRVNGGPNAMREWARRLRQAANAVDRMVDKLTEAHHK